MKSSPSLDALAVFSCAARHMNFTHAASELGVTQAAVSRRIHTLEQQLGKNLFIRSSKRKLKLTHDGEILHKAVATTLISLNEVVNNIQQPRTKNTLSITSTSGFATLWLMPRLAQFNALYPEIKVRLVLVDELLDLHSEDIDLGIRYGTGQWNNLQSKLLFGEYLYPVCSPAYLKKHPQIKDLNELTKKDLLHVEEKILTAANWTKWLKEFNIPINNIDGKLMYNNYPLLIQSCLNGQGILLGWHHMIYDLINNGQLIRPVDDVLQTNNGFYVITSKQKPPSINCSQFIDWIKIQAKDQKPPV